MNQWCASSITIKCSWTVEEPLNCFSLRFIFFILQFILYSLSFLWFQVLLFSASSGCIFIWYVFFFFYLYFTSITNCILKLAIIIFHLFSTFSLFTFVIFICSMRRSSNNNFVPYLGIFQELFSNYGTYRTFLIFSRKTSFI